jgi:hypothetical protein
MATGGTSFDDSEEQELHNWANGSLEDRLNNMVCFLMSYMEPPIIIPVLLQLTFFV